MISPQSDHGALRTNRHSRTNSKKAGDELNDVGFQGEYSSNVGSIEISYQLGQA